MKLLDLYCCAGGASVGYQRAGFDVVGVDISPQPRYPFEFVLGDAVEFARNHGREFDAIHASPPCQAHTCLRHIANKEHKDWIAETRAVLKETGLPYVIENVMGAPLENPIMLCGTYFGLKFYRHRIFECSFDVTTPKHSPHNDNCRTGKGISNKGFVSIAGDGGVGCGKGGMAYARAAMGVDWTNRAELSQAIPPAYAEFIGRQMIAHIVTSQFKAVQL